MVTISRYTAHMDELTLALITDLFLKTDRQGPGSEAAFAQMLTAAGVDRTAPLRIADIGCGTGSATIPLLQHTNATVTAVDFLPAFLERLSQRAKEADVDERLEILNADMNNLPFTDEQFDVIWSEGAIYNIGFPNGINAWRSFLKPGGTLVVSEITWLHPEPPEPLRSHWEREYPDIALPSQKISQLEQAGYTLLHYFPLPPDCWTEHYYTPLQTEFEPFLERHGHSEAAQNIVSENKTEIELYQTYQDCFSYGVYIAQKR
jgi:ubiquinone/menaquinone biosynthesis C-methylase UbiE